VVRSCPRLIEKRYRIVGVAVLDVVEGNHTHSEQFFLKLIRLSLGTAIEALPHMNSLLNARPDGFDSIEEAIEWQ
jgi:protein phosphatase methylesterase 1